MFQNKKVKLNVYFKDQKLLVISTSQKNEILYKLLKSELAPSSIDCVTSVKDASGKIISFRPDILLIDFELADIAQLQFILNYHTQHMLILGFSSKDPDQNTLLLQKWLNTYHILSIPDELSHFHSNSFTGLSFLYSLKSFFKQHSTMLSTVPCERVTSI